MIGAAVRGGTPAFGSGPFPQLRLVSVRRSDGSDNVLLRYEVVREPGRPAAPAA